MRSSTRFYSLASITALAAALTACGTPDPYGANNYPMSQPAPGTAAPYGTYPNQPSGYVEYGRITNVSMISQGTRANNSTAGTLLGAVVGGALGSQVGGGSGRAAATIRAPRK
jgi:outer membrane lipoprotein SlyB